MRYIFTTRTSLIPGTIFDGSLWKPTSEKKKRNPELKTYGSTLSTGAYKVDQEYIFLLPATPETRSFLQFQSWKIHRTFAMFHGLQDTTTFKLETAHSSRRFHSQVIRQLTRFYKQKELFFSLSFPPTSPWESKVFLKPRALYGSESRSWTSTICCCEVVFFTSGQAR